MFTVSIFYDNAENYTRMKKKNSIIVPISITSVYLVSCGLLLYFTGNIRLALIAVAFSPVLMVWIVVRIFKKNTVLAIKFDEDYYDMLDWGIGDYKKTWNKIVNIKLK
jgi:hypothetical protein